MRLGTKLALIFWACTFGTSVLTVGLFYRESSSAIRKEAGSRLADAALNASSVVDPALHAKIAADPNGHAVAYESLAHVLRRFEVANPRVRRVYTLVPSPELGGLKVVLDVGPKKAETGRVWQVPDSTQLMNGFKCAVFDPQVRSDSAGLWLSGYAPIKRADGHAIAVLGVDMSSKELMAAQRNIDFTTALALAAAFALATALSLILSSMVSRPIMELTDATRRIADGNLDHPIRVSAAGEIGSLAKSMSQMVDNIKETQAGLMRRANTDGLTGLYNHRYFHDRLAQEMKRSIRYNRPLSLLMIDLDGFKAVNDNLGHQAGDAILRGFSEILLGQVREIDVVSRYGGDEFTVILPETTSDEALQMGERIRAAVDGHSLMMGEAESAADHGRTMVWKVTLSVGVAECPSHSRRREQLISAADIAMYHAKNVSQNAVCSYNEVPGAGGEMDPCRVFAFLQSASVKSVTALAESVDAKDRFMHGHSESVARYAVGIATEMHLSEEEVFEIRIAALLHDVGNVGVPVSLIDKTGKLEDHERAIVQSHPTVGESIVKQVPQLRKILPGILYHHERYDGGGYPCGLRGEKIPLPARIICVADSFEAMTSDRPYRQALSMGQALHELNSNSGTQFDPACVESLVRWIQAEQLQAA